MFISSVPGNGPPDCVWVILPLCSLCGLLRQLWILSLLTLRFFVFYKFTFFPSHPLFNVNQFRCFTPKDPFLLNISIHKLFQLSLTSFSRRPIYFTMDTLGFGLSPFCTSSGVLIGSSFSRRLLSLLLLSLGTTSSRNRWLSGRFVLLLRFVWQTSYTKVISHVLLTLLLFVSSYFSTSSDFFVVLKIHWTFPWSPLLLPPLSCVFLCSSHWLISSLFPRLAPNPYWGVNVGLLSLDKEWINWKFIISVHVFFYP